MGLWILRVAYAAAACVLPLLNVTLLPVLLLCLPVLNEAISAMDDRITPTAGCAMLLAHCLFLPGWLKWVGCVWCVVMALMVWLPMGNDSMRRGRNWCVLYGALAVCVLALLGRMYNGQAAQGVADAIVAWVGSLPEAQTWLYKLARAGLLPVEASAAEMTAMLIAGPWGMSAAVRTQLLSSLSLRVSSMLMAAVPGLLVVGCGGLSCLCAALGDGIRAKRTGFADLPPADAWFMPRNWSLALMGLLVPGLLTLFVGGEVLGLFAQLCEGMFDLAMSVQGISLLLHLRKKHDAGVVLTVPVLLLILVMPRLLMWAGIIDQMADFRGLRPPMDFGDME